jgi:hypothetical protein
LSSSWPKIFSTTCALGLFFAIGSCSRTQVSGDPEQDKSLFASGNRGGAGQESAIDGVGAQGPSKNKLSSDEDGIDGVPRLAEDSDTDIEYPVMKFLAKGSLTSDGKTYPCNGRVTASMDDSSLKLDLTEMKIDVGKYQDKADQKTRQELGVSVYERVAKGRMARLESEKSFNNAPYMIFSEKVVKPNGKGVFSFNPPLPVFAWPAREAAYADLEENGSVTWKATVNGSYEVNVTVEYEGQSGGLIELRMTVEIPSDKNGEIYETFPMSKETVFKVDPVKRRVLRLDTVDFYYDEEKKRKERNDLVWRICSASRAGKSEDYSCE